MVKKFTQKYTIITLLEDMAEGTIYLSNDWPLHVTIADTFSINWEIDDLGTKLSVLAPKLKSATAIAAQDEYFGSEKQTQVTILDMSGGLIDLHNGVVSLLKSLGAVFNDPQYMGERFRAHATVQSNARLSMEDVVKFDNLAIVDMFPDGDPYKRKVLKLISLSGS